MINLRQIEVFYAIMRAGSITEAARVLNVTQTAVSASLKQLELRLRMTLFDRVGGRLRPTPEAVSSPACRATRRCNGSVSPLLPGRRAAIT